ncbi:unnamed protein product [Miscanthus lutarioriparius]|uniref:Uncharacterized protein n=1 Tax=Miscanthus lutarioriparius TaxID=422564 RepID=A0A811S0J4_9POAL|nr:unnamed protein product [Miscanthus lutarioriparius]
MVAVHPTGDPRICGARGGQARSRGHELAAGDPAHLLSPLWLAGPARLLLLPHPLPVAPRKRPRAMARRVRANGPAPRCGLTPAASGQFGGGWTPTKKP